MNRYFDQYIGKIIIDNGGIIKDANAYAAYLFNLTQGADMVGLNIVAFMPEYSLEDFYLRSSDYSIQMLQSMDLIAYGSYKFDSKDGITLLLFKIEEFQRFFDRIIAHQFQEEDAATIVNLLFSKAQSETTLKKIKKEGGIVGISKEMQSIFQMIEKTANTNANILLTGETGVGKSMLAKIIHDSSDRAGEPFVDINCATINGNLIESELFGYEDGAFTGARSKGKKGKIELANNGTLFLDEITEVPIDLQNRLLQVIQEKKISRIGSNNYINIDFRLISATNKDLQEQVRIGAFRQDLYYRVNVIPITIPPLRERVDDIISLSLNFLRRFNQIYSRNKSFSQGTVENFCRYNWPGNVREMENLIERLVLTSGTNSIRVSDLPEAFIHVAPAADEMQGGLSVLLDNFEKGIILDAFSKYKTSIMVGKKLGISQTTAARKIRKYLKKKDI